jgi:hypothetical protein
MRQRLTGTREDTPWLLRFKKKEAGNREEL